MLFGDYEVFQLFQHFLVNFVIDRIVLKLELVVEVELKLVDKKANSLGELRLDRKNNLFEPEIVGVLFVLLVVGRIVFIFLFGVLRKFSQKNQDLRELCAFVDVKNEVFMD